MKLLYSIFIIFCINLCMGQNFSAGGINYQITTESPPQALVRPSLFNGDLVIPSTIMNPGTGLTYTVTRIGNNAFDQNGGITSVIIPNSVTTIGQQAFRSCVNISSITVPNSVTSIDSDAFRSCGRLLDVTIGSSVTSIGADAFNSCNSIISFTVNRTTPPTTGTNIFFQTSIATATLLVPANALNSYNIAPWSSFGSRAALPTPAPTAISTSQTFCISGTIANLQATGTDIKWYSASTGGSLLPATTALINNTTYFATQTINGQESTSRLAVTAQLNTTPTAAPTVTSPQNLSNNATLAFLTATGTNIKWYNSMTGGSALPETTTLINGTTYFASQTVNSCESINRAAVVANVAAVLPATHLNFDGINDNVSLPINIGNTLSGGTEMTIEYWFKGSNLQSAVRIQSGGSYISAGWANNTGSLRFIISSDGGINGVDIANPTLMYNGNWHHVAFVWKKNTIMATYVDGVLSNSRVANNVNLPTFSGTNTFIGSFNGQAEFLNGNIDEVRIWNVALSSTEITQRRWTELAGNEAGLLAYYKFNQGNNAANNTSIVTLNGSATNAYNGTLLGFANTGTTSNWLAGSPIVSGTLIPIPPTAAAQTFCGSATVANLVATGTGIINWYSESSGGLALSSSTALATGSYFASQTINSVESIRVLVPVTIITNLTGPTAASQQTFCPGARVTDLVASSTGIIKWYVTATSTAPLFSTEVLVNGSYFATQTIGTCESTTRTPVQVTISTIPVAPTAIATQVFTSGNTLATLQIVGSNISWYPNATGGPRLPSNTVIVSGTTYFASQTISGCESASRVAILAIQISPSFQNLPASATVADLIATPIAGQKAFWFATATSTPSLPLTTPLVTGTYYVVMAPIGSNLRTISGILNTTNVTNRVAVNVVISTPSNNAINFVNGSDDRLRVPNNVLLNPTTAITVECWVRRNTTPRNYGIIVSKTSQDISWTGGYGLHWDFNGTSISFFTNGWSGNVLTSSTIIPANTWTHVAGTYDGVTKRIYINGVLDISRAQTSAIGSNNLDLYIGSNNLPTFVNSGDIDMVRVWSIARTAAEINNNQGNCITAGTTGLVAQYDFEEAVGSTTFSDTSGNNLTGTFVNMETSDWISGGNCGNYLALSTPTIALDRSIKVYPNPSNDIFNIVMETDATIEIHDLLGKTIMILKVSSGNSQINLSDYARGIYLMKITHESSQQKTIKLVKQ